MHVNMVLLEGEKNMDLRKKSISDKLSTLLAISLLLASITSIATFINLIPLAEASGTVGKALSSDGLDDCAAVPAIDANVYTFELWFKPETNFALIGSNRFLIQTADDSLTVWHDVYVGPQNGPPYQFVQGLGIT